MMAAMVAPLGCRSRARTASCLVPPRAGANGMVGDLARKFVHVLACEDSVFLGALLCDILRVLSGCDGLRRRHRRSPTVAASPAGQDPGRGTTGPDLGMATVTLPSRRKST